MGRLRGRCTHDYDYVAKLTKGCFKNIEIETTRVYGIEDARAFLTGQGLAVDSLAKEIDGKFISASATKSAASCAPGCCA